MIQFCLSNTYPRNHTVEHENISDIPLLGFLMQAQVCLIRENRKSLEYFALDRPLKST